MASNKEKYLNQNQVKDFPLIERSGAKTLNTKNIRKESTNPFSKLRKLSVTQLYSLSKLSTPIKNNFVKSITTASYPHLSVSHTFKPMKSNADHKTKYGKPVSTLKNSKESVITEKLSQKAITDLTIDIPKLSTTSKPRFSKPFTLKISLVSPTFVTPALVASSTIRQNNSEILTTTYTNQPMKAISKPIYKSTAPLPKKSTISSSISMKSVTTSMIDFVTPSPFLSSNIEKVVTTHRIESKPTIPKPEKSDAIKTKTNLKGDIHKITTNPSIDFLKSITPSKLKSSKYTTFPKLDLLTYTAFTKLDSSKFVELTTSPFPLSETSNQIESSKLLNQDHTRFQSTSTKSLQLKPTERISPTSFTKMALLKSVSRPDIHALVTEKNRFLPQNISSEKIYSTENIFDKTFDKTTKRFMTSVEMKTNEINSPQLITSTEMIDSDNEITDSTSDENIVTDPHSKRSTSSLIMSKKLYTVVIDGTTFDSIGKPTIDQITTQIPLNIPMTRKKISEKGGMTSKISPVYSLSDVKEEIDSTTTKDIIEKISTPITFSLTKYRKTVIPLVMENNLKQNKTSNEKKSTKRTDFTKSTIISEEMSPTEESIKFDGLTSLRTPKKSTEFLSMKVTPSFTTNTLLSETLTRNAITSETLSFSEKSSQKIKELSIGMTPKTISSSVKTIPKIDTVVSELNIDKAISSTDEAIPEITTFFITSNKNGFTSSSVLMSPEVIASTPKTFVRTSDLPFMSSRVDPKKKDLRVGMTNKKISSSTEVSPEISSTILSEELTNMGDISFSYKTTEDEISSIDKRAKEVTVSMVKSTAQKALLNITNRESINNLDLIENTIKQMTSSQPITSTEAPNSGKGLSLTSKMTITQIPSAVTKPFLRSSNTFSSEDSDFHSTTKLISKQNIKKTALTQTFTKTKVTIDQDKTVEKTTHSYTSDEDISTPSIRITTFEGKVSINKAKSAQIYQMLGIKGHPLKNVFLQLSTKRAKSENKYNERMTTFESESSSNDLYTENEDISTPSIKITTFEGKLSTNKAKRAQIYNMLGIIGHPLKNISLGFVDTSELPFMSSRVYTKKKDIRLMTTNKEFSYSTEVSPEVSPTSIEDEEVDSLKSETLDIISSSYKTTEDEISFLNKRGNKGTISMIKSTAQKALLNRESTSSQPIVSTEAPNLGNGLSSTLKIITEVPRSITKSSLQKFKMSSSEDSDFHSTTESISVENTEKKAFTQMPIPFSETKVTIDQDNTVGETTHSYTRDGDISTPSIRITTFEGKVSTNKAKRARIFKILGIKGHPLKNISLGFVDTSELPFMSSKVYTKKKDIRLMTTNKEFSYSTEVSPEVSPTSIEDEEVASLKSLTSDTISSSYKTTEDEISSMIKRAKKVTVSMIKSTAQKVLLNRWSTSSQPIVSTEAPNLWNGLSSTLKIITEVPRPITKSFLQKYEMSSSEESISVENTEKKAVTQTPHPISKTKVTIDQDNTVEETTHSYTSDEDISTPSIRITTFEGKVSSNKAKSAQIYQMLGIKGHPLKNVSLQLSTKTVKSENKNNERMTTFESESSLNDFYTENDSNLKLIDENAIKTSLRIKPTTGKMSTLIEKSVTPSQITTKKINSLKDISSKWFSKKGNSENKKSDKMTTEKSDPLTNDSHSDGINDFTPINKIQNTSESKINDKKQKFLLKQFFNPLMRRTASSPNGSTIENKGVVTQTMDNSEQNSTESSMEMDGQSIGHTDHLEDRLNSHNSTRNGTSFVHKFIKSFGLNSLNLMNKLATKLKVPRLTTNSTRPEFIKFIQLMKDLKSGVLDHKVGNLTEKWNLWHKVKESIKTVRVPKIPAKTMKSDKFLNTSNPNIEQNDSSDNEMIDLTSEDNTIEVNTHSTNSTNKTIFSNFKDFMKSIDLKSLPNFRNKSTKNDSSENIDSSSEVNNISNTDSTENKETKTTVKQPSSIMSHKKEDNKSSLSTLSNSEEETESGKDLKIIGSTESSNALNDKNSFKSNNTKEKSSGNFKNLINSIKLPRSNYPYNNLTDINTNVSIDSIMSKAKGWVNKGKKLNLFSNRNKTDSLTDERTESSLDSNLSIKTKNKITLKPITIEFTSENNIIGVKTESTKSMNKTVFPKYKNYLKSINLKSLPHFRSKTTPKEDSIDDTDSSSEVNIIDNTNTTQNKEDIKIETKTKPIIDSIRNETKKDAKSDKMSSKIHGFVNRFKQSGRSLSQSTNKTVSNKNDSIDNITENIENTDTDGTALYDNTNTLKSNKTREKVFESFNKLKNSVRVPSSLIKFKKPDKKSTVSAINNSDSEGQTESDNTLRVEPNSESIDVSDDKNFKLNQTKERSSRGFKNLMNSVKLPRSFMRNRKDEHKSTVNKSTVNQSPQDLNDETVTEKIVRKSTTKSTINITIKSTTKKNRIEKTLNDNNLIDKNTNVRNDTLMSKAKGWVKKGKHFNLFSVRNKTDYSPEENTDSDVDSNDSELKVKIKDKIKSNSMTTHLTTELTTEDSLNDEVVETPKKSKKDKREDRSLLKLLSKGTKLRLVL